MGSRGAFVDVNTGDFTFKDNGQTYFSIGTLSDDKNVKVLIQESGAVKAPEYSHTGERVYAIVQQGYLKHLAFYDADHKQHISVDLLHEHGGVQPHIHIDLQHNKKDPGIPPTPEQEKLIKKIKKEFNLL
jgi:hypothetical protein